MVASSKMSKAYLAVAALCVTQGAVYALECGDFNSQDCVTAFDNAQNSKKDMTAFEKRCMNEGGSQPLRARCALCCDKTSDAAEDEDASDASDAVEDEEDTSDEAVMMLTAAMEAAVSETEAALGLATPPLLELAVMFQVGFLDEVSTEVNNLLASTMVVLDFFDAKAFKSTGVYADDGNAWEWQGSVSTPDQYSDFVYLRTKPTDEKNVVERKSYYTDKDTLKPASDSFAKDTLEDVPTWYEAAVADAGGGWYAGGPLFRAVKSLYDSDGKYVAQASTAIRKKAIDDLLLDAADRCCPDNTHLFILETTDDSDKVALVASSKGAVAVNNVLAAQDEEVLKTITQKLVNQGYLETTPKNLKGGRTGSPKAKGGGKTKSGKTVSTSGHDKEDEDEDEDEEELKDAMEEEELRDEAEAADAEELEDAMEDEEVKDKIRDADAVDMLELEAEVRDSDVVVLKGPVTTTTDGDYLVATQRVATIGGLGALDDDHEWLFVLAWPLEDVVKEVEDSEK